MVRKVVRGDGCNTSVDDANDKSLIFDYALADYNSDDSVDSCSDNLSTSMAGTSYNDGSNDDDDEDDDNLEQFGDNIENGVSKETTSQSDVELLASRENKWVEYARTLIVLSLIGSAVTASCLTYYFVNKSDSLEFVKQFAATSEQLVEKLLMKTQNAIYTTEFLGNIISSSSSSSQSNSNTFPYFTMDDFETFGQRTIDLSGATMVGFAPIITDIERFTWEGYSYVKQGWIETGHQLCDNCNKGNNSSFPIFPFIYQQNESSFDTTEREETTNVYSP
jgi:hypothetical protein